MAEEQQPSDGDEESEDGAGKAPSCTICLCPYEDDEVVGDRPVGLGYGICSSLVRHFKKRRRRRIQSCTMSSLHCLTVVLPTLLLKAAVPTASHAMRARLRAVSRQCCSGEAGSLRAS